MAGRDEAIAKAVDRLICPVQQRMCVVIALIVDAERRSWCGRRSPPAADRVAAFGIRLAAVNERNRDAADLAAAESARMLADLNEAAVRAVSELTARVGAQVDAVLSGQLRSAPPAQIERDGRARLAGLAVDAAESWRREQAGWLEDGLGHLDQRLTESLQAELDAVRGAAAEQLGLDLTVPGPGERLTSDEAGNGGVSAVPDERQFAAASAQPASLARLEGAIGGVRL